MSRRKDAPPPRTGASEMAVLRGFLDYLRTSIAAKVEDAPEPDVPTPGVASGTNLLGLINHLTEVERSTFLAANVRNWQKTFHASPDHTVAEVIARYRATVVEANEVLDRTEDLGQPLREKGPSARWALTHMIEETGRHAGHADILRELIDGATGR